MSQPVLVVSSFALRAHPLSRDGVEGWLPLVSADVRDASGPLELVLGGRSFEVPTSSSGDGVSSRELLPDGAVLTEPGEFSFELRMRGATLFEGSAVVERVDSGTWLVRPAELPPAAVVVQASADEDAPWFAVTAWLPGEVGEYDVQCALLHDGSSVDVELDVDSARLVGGATRIQVESSAVRGWLLADYSESDEWIELFENPGEYVVEVGDASVPFSVVDGVLRTEGPAELDLRGDLVLFTSDGPSWGGRVTYAVDVREWYERFIEFEGEADADSASDAGSGAGDERVQAVVEGVTTNEGTYLDDLAAGGGSLDHDQVDYALSDFTALRDRVVALRGEFADDAALADAARRLDELIRLAERFLHGESEAADAQLEPYRAVLHGDKLAVCLDRPPHEYRYLTAGKREISTPDELAAAASWYFEGGGSEGGVLFEVSTWSVLGFHFDPEHTLLDRTETSGLGPSAPSSAFP